MGRRYLKSCEPGYRPRTRLEIPRGAVSDRYPLDILSLVRSLVVNGVPGVPEDPWRFRGIPGDPLRFLESPGYSACDFDSPAAHRYFLFVIYLSYGGQPGRPDK